MKKKSLTKNYFYNLTYQILVVILPLITTPYVSRVLGAESIGIYSYTLSVVTYFILFGSLGIASYGQREIAYLQDDKNKYSKTFWEILLLRLVTMVISMLTFFLIFIIGNNDYKIYYCILILEMIANCIDISWFFQGLEEFKKTVIRNVIVKVISVICIFMFVKTKEDLWIYFVIYVLSTFIGNLSLWLYLPKYLVKVNFKKLDIYKHFKPTIALFIPQIAIQIYTVLDKVMIGSMIPDKSISGYYEQAQKVIKLLMTIITSLGTVMLPRIANIYAKGNKEEIKNILYKSFNFVFLLSFPMIFGILLVSKNFVPLFFGKGYDQVSILMCIIVPIILFIGLSNVIGTQYLLPTKRQKEFTISVVVGAIVNFIINLLLIKRYGAIGASIGTVIAELCVTVTQFIFVRKDFDLYHILEMSVKYICASVVMFIVCFSLNIYLDNGKLIVILDVIVGSIVFFISLIIVRDKFILGFFNKFLKK